MKIVVCIKQVVDTNDIKWTPNNTIDRNGVQSIINPCDMLALETALRIKDKNPEEYSVVVVSMGPKQAEDALKTAIAMGCDEAFLLCDKKFSGADTVATSKTISSGIKKICPDFDLIICGQFASDGDTAQTGPSIAQKLNVEQITYVTEIAEYSSSNLKVLRKSDDNIELIEAPLPALVCMTECPYVARDILIDGYIKAQDYSIGIINLEDLGLSAENVGIKGSPTWVSRAFRALSVRDNAILNCNADECIEKFTEIINSIDGKVESISNINSLSNVNILHNCDLKDKRKILVWGEFDNYKNFRDVVFQLASKARELSGKLENSCVTLITALDCAELFSADLRRAGVDELVILNSEVLAEYNTQNYAKAILQYLDKYPAEIFLLGATKQGRDLAPQISSALSTGLTADCTGLEINSDKKLAATRPTFGGELMATILCKTLPQMATVRAGVFSNLGDSSGDIAVNIFYPEITDISAKKVLKYFEQKISDDSLDCAKIVLAGGKGLKDKATFEKLEKLADCLGAKVGATRKAVDAGLAPYSAQIGQTGKTIAPKLYIAFGISGAIQHCVGISAADKIIAINTDENAPITKAADLTIIADAKEVIDRWLEKFQNN